MEIRLEALEVKVDDGAVAGTLLTPATAYPGVLFVHGWGGSQEQDLARAREAAGLGCVCMTFDLRGHARTQQQKATITREQNLRDLVAAYDAFAAHPGVDPASIAVVGSSYGGYLATLLTETRPVRWLALRVPALYKDAGWETPKMELNKDADLLAYRKRELQPGDNRALRASAAYRGDVLIVESEHDEHVPHPVIANYVTAFKTAHSLTSRVIKEADHALSQKHWERDYTSILVGWLTEMVVGARTAAAKKDKSDEPQIVTEEIKRGVQAGIRKAEEGVIRPA